MQKTRSLGARMHVSNLLISFSGTSMLFLFCNNSRAYDYGIAERCRRLDQYRYRRLCVETDTVQEHLYASASVLSARERGISRIFWHASRSPEHLRVAWRRRGSRPIEARGHQELFGESQDLLRMGGQESFFCLVRLCVNRTALRPQLYNIRRLHL